MSEIIKYLKEYNFIFLWLIGGAINIYFGAFFVVISFLMMIKKERYINVVISFWLLLIFSDSSIGILRFAHLVKPTIMALVGFSSVFLLNKCKLKNTFFLSFVPFFLYLMVSVFFHENILISFQKGLSYLFIFYAPVALFLLIQKQGRTEELFRGFIFLGNFVLFISLVLSIILPEVGAQFGGRLNGIFRNPNGIGVFVALYSIFSYLIYHTISFHKNSRRITLILILLVLVLSGSRSALGAVLIFFIGVLLSNKSPWFFVIFTIFFFVVYQGIYDLVIIFVNQMGYSELFRLDTLDMASGRIYVWQAAWKEINNDLFFFGGGFTYSESRFWLKKYYMEIPDLIQHQGNVHQSFLSFWMNTGIVGLTLFAFGWLRNILIALKKSPFSLTIVAAVVFSASYESWLIASLNPVTIQLIFIFTIIIFYKKKQGENPDNNYIETKIETNEFT